MAYYRTCPLCGSNLDPGESCDCEDEREKAQEQRKRQIRRMHNSVWMPPDTNQYHLKMAVGFNDR